MVSAIALLAEPRLKIADEPTTFLDVTVQSHVLKSMAACGAFMILIAHDLAEGLSDG